MVTPAGEGPALHCQPYQCEEAANHYTRRGCNLQDTRGQFESEGVPEVPSSHRCLTCLAIHREQGRKTAPSLPLVCFSLLLKPVHLSNVCYTLSSVLKLLQQCVHEAPVADTILCSIHPSPIPPSPQDLSPAPILCFRCQETMVRNKRMVSLPSMILIAILHCWKCSYTDSYSDHLCFLSMPSRKIKYYALCLMLFPFSSVPSSTFWVLFGAKNCLSPTPSIDKQAYKSQQPDPSPASKKSITGLKKPWRFPESWCPNQTLGQIPFVSNCSLKVLATLTDKEHRFWWWWSVLYLSIQSYSNACVNLVHRYLQIITLFSIGGSNSYLHWKASNKLEHDKGSDNLNSYDKTYMSRCSTFSGAPPGHNGQCQFVHLPIMSNRSCLEDALLGRPLRLRGSNSWTIA